jgi:hypothetical protein
MTAREAFAEAEAGWVAGDMHRIVGFSLRSGLVCSDSCKSVESCGEFDSSRN